jgi:hypothetical protein
LNEPEKKWDATYLYVRTDEKYEEVKAEVHDMKLEQKDLKNSLERIEKRVDFGVAITGNKNTEELGKHAVDIGQLKQTQELHALKLTDLEKSLGDKLEHIDKSVDLIYKGIVTIFFTLVIGGIVIYALKFFHFS